MRLLNLDSRGEKIVGIQGIGGMGKTTIAKAVYDNICAGFNRCCFLENTRELLTKNDGIVSLQNKLISRILRDEVQVKNASEGVNMIREKVCKYKVLVVLDDVDDKFEFDQILGKLGDYSFESRFILTTRDKRVLELLPECKLYEPKEMSHAHSVHLFSRHAFGMQYIPEGYGALCDEFVKVGAKLPLALKLIGSLLFRRDRQFWEDQLMELKDLCATNNKVQASLKISYDDLSCNAKNIFLDIACFFIGEDKELPFHMWSDCKRYPESGLRTLVLRSLIKVDERNQFWMHDLVRDLGRAIVIEEDVKNPCKRSRIWSYEDAMNVLKTKEGTDQVEMLKINMLDDDSNQKLTVKTFEKLARLKYLDMEFPRLTGDFSGILPDMRWLRLRGCQSLPTDLNLEKVVILDLEDCWVTDDWRGWSGIQVAHKLKVINLRGCYKLHKVPNLTQCENLEFIDLTNCFEMSGELRIGSFWNLKVVRHPWSGTIDLTGDMGKLQKLQEINTGKLVKIPRDIWQLTKLKTLQLVLCFCNESLLVALTSLIFKCCKHLNRLPNLGRLNNLMELRLVDVGVTEIHSLGELRMLEVLEISESHVGNLYGLDNLVQLKELTLKKCHRLENLPSLSNLIKLHSLVIIKCSLLCEIQGLVELRRLKQLSISWWRQLPEVTGLGRLISLKTLKMIGCTSLRRLPDLSGLKNLENLDVSCCMLLVDVTGVDRLESLQTLTFSDCWSLKELPDISSLKSLEELNVDECTELIKVAGLEKLEKLEKLRMRNCKSIKELPDMSGLKNLKELSLMGCTRLTKVVGLDKLEELRGLNMCGCESIKKLPDMSGLKNLMYLNLKGCIHLKDVKGLQKLKNLGYMEMASSGPHKQLPDLSLLRELKELRIIGWVEFTEVKGLERLTSLKSLVMLSCLSLRRFPDLSGLKDLERLIVGSCNQLVDVTGIRGLDSLLKLELSCSLIEELPDTSGMKNLRQLDVSQCSRLTKVVGLDKLEELRGLNMCGCESIKKLPDMSRLKNLMYLNLKGCIHLKDVKGLEKLKNLGYMEMEKRLKVKHYLKSATSYGKQYGKQLARSVQNRLKN
ncbi:Disease resistance protein L6 [Linum grandiflorum]